MSLHLDVSQLSCACTDHALEVMHKAMVDPPDTDAVWLPHPEPLIRGTIETLSGEGASILRRILDGLVDVVRQNDRAHKATGFGPSLRDLAEASARLNAKPARSWTVEDWLVLVDLLLETYLPAGVIRTQAEYASVRAAIAGKIKASLPDVAPDSGYEARLPSTVAAALRADIDFTPLEMAMLEVSRARAAEAITFLGEATRHRIKRILIDFMERQVTGDPVATARRLEQDLSDEFAILNRDWRRIAVTETGNLHNEAVIASITPGTRVRRFEAYEGACPFCRKIDGMEFEVVAPDAPHKDGWTQVWPGKTNVGRSASPRKRVGEDLIEREPHELWWPAAGTQHPNCRGGWLVVPGSARALDPKTQAALQALLVKHGFAS